MHEDAIESLKNWGRVRRGDRYTFLNYASCSWQQQYRSPRQDSPPISVLPNDEPDAERTQRIVQSIPQQDLKDILHLRFDYLIKDRHIAKMFHTDTPTIKLKAKTAVSSFVMRSGLQHRSIRVTINLAG